MTWEFDHVGIATFDSRPVLALLSGELGGTILFGKVTSGFRWVLVRLGDAERGFNVEVLDPWKAPEDHFLTRFLVRRGEGLHHLTFKTTDLAAALPGVKSAGFEPIDIDLASPTWKEAFISPRETGGVLIQLAELRMQRPPLAEMLEQARSGKRDQLDRWAVGEGQSYEWWQAPPRRPAAISWLRAGLRVPSLARALGLYGGALGGRASEAAAGADVEWSSSLPLRLEQYDEPEPAFRIEGRHQAEQANLEVAGARIVLLDSRKNHEVEQP
jgi:methylmalonyl-CoA/ethylmalonyl-CoA epimerase